MKRIVILLIWLACAVFNYGMTMGYFTHHYPWDTHYGVSMFTAAMGPFGVPVVLIAAEPPHWRIKPLSTEERWKAFHGRWPSLSRDYFEQEDN